MGWGKERHRRSFLFCGQRLNKVGSRQDHPSRSALLLPARTTCPGNTHICLLRPPGHRATLAPCLQGSLCLFHNVGARRPHRSARSELCQEHEMYRSKTPRSLTFIFLIDVFFSFCLLKHPLAVTEVEMSALNRDVGSVGSEPVSPRPPRRSIGVQPSRGRSEEQKG